MLYLIQERIVKPTWTVHVGRQIHTFPVLIYRHRYTTEEEEEEEEGEEEEEEEGEEEVGTALKFIHQMDQKEDPPSGLIMK